MFTIPTYCKDINASRITVRLTCNLLVNSFSGKYLSPGCQPPSAICFFIRFMAILTKDSRWLATGNTSLQALVDVYLSYHIRLTSVVFRQLDDITHSCSRDINMHTP